MTIDIYVFKVTFGHYKILYGIWKWFYSDIITVKWLWKMQQVGLSTFSLIILNSSFFFSLAGFLYKAVSDDANSCIQKYIDSCYLWVGFMLEYYPWLFVSIHSSFSDNITVAEQIHSLHELKKKQKLIYQSYILFPYKSIYFLL